MPVGIIPSFSDSDWEPSGTWIAVFEEAAHLFKDSKYGAAAAQFRDCADRLFRYGQEAAQGKCLGDVFYALPVTDELDRARRNPAGFRHRPAAITRGGMDSEQGDPFGRGGESKGRAFCHVQHVP